MTFSELVFSGFDKASGIPEYDYYNAMVENLNNEKYMMGAEKALDIERVLVFWPAEWSLATTHCESSIYCNIAKFITAVGQCLAKHFRNGCTSLDVDAFAGIYEFDGLRGGEVFHCK